MMTFEGQELTDREKRIFIAGMAANTTLSMVYLESLPEIMAPHLEVPVDEGQAAEISALANGLVARALQGAQEEAKSKIITLNGGN